MDAAPSPVGVATASSVPLPGWPEKTAWVAPPGDLSVRLPSAPAPVWPRAAQGATACLLLLALGLLAWHAYGGQRWGCRPTTLEPGVCPDTRIDLNRADHAQLVQLSGVGDGLANRIEAYRQQHGGFRDVEELRRVGGIGPAMLERLRPFVYVEPYEREEGGVPEPMPKEQPAGPVHKKKVLPAEPIDINRATAAELQGLPGIGPKMAQRIIDTRRQKPFQSVDDLRRVPGIGPKILQRLRPHIVVVP